MQTSNRLTTPWGEKSMILFLIFALTFLIVYHYGRQLLRQIQLAMKIPGPSTFTMMCKSLNTIKADPVDMYKIAIELKEGLDDIAKAWFGPRLVIFLYNPADVEVILGSSVYLDKSSEYSVFKPWFGNGLLISTGAKWKHHRKMIAPTFHQSILKTFVPTFYQNSLKVCKKMAREDGKTFDCHEYMSGTTVDILLETAMGYKEPRTEETGFNYAMAVMKLCDILHRRHYKVWLRSDYIFEKTKYAIDHSRLLKVIKNLTTKVVRSKKREHIKRSTTEESTFEKIENVQKEENIPRQKITGYNNGTAVRDDLDEVDENDVGEKKRLAFLEQLTANALNKDVEFTEEEVLDQVNTIMFEGHDTTAAGSSFCLVMLGIHQDIQDKVVDEVNDIFQNSDRECTFADTLEMNFLERVIMETLRMYPPVPIIARVLKEEVKLKTSDIILPIGATVAIVQAILHRRPDTFPNPDVFNPDHFLPEKCQERHYYSYVPFSAGPRSCVGRKFAMLKLKVLMSTILRNYRVHCDLNEKDIRLQGDIILKIADGFNIRLEPKKNVC